MSKRTLSPSNTPTGMTRGLAMKLTEMSDHKLLKSPVFEGVPTAEIDEFVKAVGPEIAVQVAELAERRFQAYIGRYIVPVDYDVPEVIVKAIAENEFGFKWVDVDPANIPVIGRGQVVEEVHEVHFGKVMYNRDLPNALKEEGKSRGFKLGFKFANPLTALRWAKANPDKQREYPLGILFYDANGRLCCLYLNGYDRERYLGVRRDYPVVYWDEDVRFLAVPELEPLAA